LGYCHKKVNLTKNTYIFWASLCAVFLKTSGPHFSKSIFSKVRLDLSLFVLHSNVPLSRRQTTSARLWQYISHALHALSEYISFKMYSDNTFCIHCMHSWYTFTLKSIPTIHFVCTACILRIYIHFKMYFDNTFCMHCMHSRNTFSLKCSPTIDTFCISLHAFLEYIYFDMYSDNTFRISLHAFSEYIDLKCIPTIHFVCTACTLGIHLL
jgi:hypothetical protein